MSGNSSSIHKSRPPVINPFDKLSQKQFDSYVSSIQAKIKVALEPPSPEPHHVSRTFAEISRSTIASPAPSPAPLSKHPSQDTRPSSRVAHTPIGTGTPNEPYELSDDEGDGDDEIDRPASETRQAGSRSALEAPGYDEQQPLSAIQEGSDEPEEDEAESDEPQHSADDEVNDNYFSYVGAWGHQAGEELLEADKVEEEEEDVFIGKGKGRHPAEGPGLAGLLNGSSAHRASGAPNSPERSGASLHSPDNSFEAGVARMPTLGTTSTPFVSRFVKRRSVQEDQESEDEDDTGSPPWENEKSMPAPIAERSEEDEDSGETSGDEPRSAGAGQHNAIEVLDSDEETGSTRKLERTDASSRSTSDAAGDIYADLPAGINESEIDELQFDDSTAFLRHAYEPDSLLDDSIDEYETSGFPSRAGMRRAPSSSLFSGSSPPITRERSQSRETERLDDSADTVQAQDRSIEEPAQASTVREEVELDQPSIQQSMDYSDFIGEKSLLASQTDTSLTRTQADANFLEVTVYELENGSRYYDHDGLRHFINPEGEVYEACPIPPPRPTIQRPPDLSMIEEVSEYDMTRRMTEQDEEEAPDRFDFLKGLGDTFSSVGAPVLRYPDEDTSNNTFNMDDIPQRPGAAMGFRGREASRESASAFLSDSAVIADDSRTESDTGRSPGRNYSLTGTLEESMTGRNADDLISDVDELANEGADGDSIDSILDDDEEDSQDRSGMSALVDREGAATPVPLPPHPSGEGELGVQELFELDEKGVADALAAVAQLAETSPFQGMDAENEASNDTLNPLDDPKFNTYDDVGNLIDVVTGMSAAEEDILARSFSMADALESATVPLGELHDIAEMVVPESNFGQKVMVENNVLNEIAQNLYQDSVSLSVPEKLASEVLAEVFEGADPIVLPSGPGTGATTPSELVMREAEPTTYIGEVEVHSRSPTPRPSGTASTENQGPSPRRTPPTPTLSAGQSLTAPEPSVATSISGLYPNISIYEGSPASSTHRDDIARTIPPEVDPTQLPDPNLPPAPTHLSMPTVPSDIPDSSGAHREISPSVMVEPPTPYTRSDDGAAEAGSQDAKLKMDDVETTSNGQLAVKSTDAAPVSDQDEEVDVDGLLEQVAGSAENSRNEAESNLESGQTSESRVTPSPPERIQRSDKRKRLLDEAQPLTNKEQTSPQSKSLGNNLVKSPLSDSVPLPRSPVARNYQSLFKRIPTSGPLSTASESSSGRKTSGSDHGGPAPWPLRHRTHHHRRPSSSPEVSKSGTSGAGSPMTRSNCRYHKISIPVDDDGNVRVEFIVPRCALGNQEIMKEQDIEDCGLSTPSEEHTMVMNLGDLDPILINKLMVLVGASLLNEGVCGYIEKPTVPKASRSALARSKSLKSSLRKASTDSKTDSPGTDKEGRSSSPRTKPKPRSRASIRHDDRPYKPPADESESDESTGGEPIRKRSKRRVTGAATSSVKFPTLGPESPQKPADSLTAHSTGSYVPISKRMKRARRPADAQPYKPDPKDQESSTDPESGRSPRKRTKRQNSATTRRTGSKGPKQDRKQTSEEIDPFKPKHELKRLLSPPVTNKAEAQSSISTMLPDSQSSNAEQKDLERHISLSGKLGEVVDEAGEPVEQDNLEPKPAQVSIHVDRNTHTELGKNDSKGTENPSGTKGKRGWRFLRF